MKTYTFNNRSRPPTTRDDDDVSFSKFNKVPFAIEEESSTLSMGSGGNKKYSSSVKIHNTDLPVDSSDEEDDFGG